MKKELLLLLILGLFILLVPAAGWPGSTRPMLKIGLIGPFEGEYRNKGYEALAAVKQALNEENSQPGAGYRLELVALNDFNQADEARIQARSLVLDDKIMAVVGGYAEGSAAASAEVLENERMPFLSLIPGVCADNACSYAHAPAIDGRSLSIRLAACRNELSAGVSDLKAAYTPGGLYKRYTALAQGSSPIEEIQEKDIAALPAGGLLLVTGDRPGLLSEWGEWQGRSQSSGALLIPEALSQQMLDGLDRSGSAGRPAFVLEPMLKKMESSAFDNAAYEKMAASGSVTGANTYIMARLLLDELRAASTGGVPSREALAARLNAPGRLGTAFRYDDLSIYRLAEGRFSAVRDCRQ